MLLPGLRTADCPASWYGSRELCGHGRGGVFPEMGAFLGASACYPGNIIASGVLPMRALTASLCALSFL